MGYLDDTADWQLSHTVWQSRSNDEVIIRNESTGHLHVSQDFIPPWKATPDGTTLQSRQHRIPLEGNKSAELAYRAPCRPLYPRHKDIEKLVHDFKRVSLDNEPAYDPAKIPPPLLPPLEDLPDIIRYALRFPSHLLPGPRTAPECWSCGLPGERRRARSNKNGNKGRYYYKCMNGVCPRYLEDGVDFLVFDDRRGNCATNPFCGCGRPSKITLGRRKGGMRRLLLVCRFGECEVVDYCAGWLREEYVPWAKGQMLC
ncbi:hypothetical protein KEM55_002099 [Ascosphaera atra]|nr:hypothetical protein KEM55_002099 [Ascosphaera atra]